MRKERIDCNNAATPADRREDVLESVQEQCKSDDGLSRTFKRLTAGSWSDLQFELD